MSSTKWEGYFLLIPKGNPDFREVQAKLAQARDERQRAQWYDEAIAHGEAERWAEACQAWVRVLRGRLDYRGGEAAERLLEATRGLLKRYVDLGKGYKRARRVAALYEKLVLAVESGEWPEAVEVGEELAALAPDLEGAQAWVERARRHAQRQAQPAPEPPTPPSQGDTMIWEKDGKEMVRVPAGEFLYGDDKEKRELPEFWIDKMPLTNAEYAHFVRETGHKSPKHWDDEMPPEKIDNHPVIYVSWHDAVAYAEWAGKRLPTEEEWEKAARGTDGREYPWGDEQPTPELCNYDKNESGTTPVGKYSPQGDSPYGCVDMAGNVWEWTASDYNKDNCVLRGGSWVSISRYVRAADRNRGHPTSSYNDIGFRCVAVTPQGS